MKVLIFDTETTGLPVRGASLQLQPAIVQFAAVIGHLDPSGAWQEVGRMKWHLNPRKKISPDASAVHGITDSMVAGAPSFENLDEVLAELIEGAEVVAGHNVTFDLEVARWERQRMGLHPYSARRVIDTMLLGTDLCKLPGRMGSYKWPKLSELHRFLFGAPFDGAHDALADVDATLRCLVEMGKRGIIPEKYLGISAKSVPYPAADVPDTF